MTPDALNLYDVLMFQIDLFTYALTTLGLKWTRPSPAECRRFFQPFHGDAILRYRNGWDEQFRTRIRLHRSKDLLCPAGIAAYVEGYARECFGNHPAESVPTCFFVFSAFLVDLAVFCCRYERPDLIETVIFCVLNTFDAYLAPLQEEEFWRGFLQVIGEQTAAAGR